jgi:hypothetical protein
MRGFPGVVEIAAGRRHLLLRDREAGNNRLRRDPLQGHHRPGGHRNVIDLMVSESVKPTAAHRQGFRTSRGRFVGRAEALKVARAAGQVGRKTGRELFTDDLW